MIHSFSVEVATEYSIDKAIILHNFYFWVKENHANKRNIYKGKAYTYNTAEAFAELFPYLKPRKIAELLREMEYDGLIESIQNKGTNRVKSYTLTDKGWSFYTTVHEASNIQNNDSPSYENQTMEHTEVRLSSITDSKHTDSKHTDNKTNDLSSTKSDSSIPEIKEVTEKLSSIPNMKTAKELELEKSFDEAIASVTTSPCNNCENDITIDTKKKAKRTGRKPNSATTPAALESDDFYKPIYEAYKKAFFSIYPVGTIPNCGKYKIYVDDCIKRYNELQLGNNQIRDLIINAIENATKDNYIKKNRFPIAMILSEKVMPRLVDASAGEDKPEIGVSFGTQAYERDY